jgi:hypothetical protein
LERSGAYYLTSGVYGYSASDVERRSKMSASKRLLLACIFLFIFHSTAFAWDQVALTIAGEAGGEGKAGMQAVACVIQNRSRLSHKSADSVVMRGFYGRTNKVAVTLYLRNKGYIDSLVASMGKIQDITNGATHFENVEAFGLPAWARKMVRTVKIRHHTFFK